MRIGLDLGGTKISGVALGANGETLTHARVATPQGYENILAICDHLIAELEKKTGIPCSVGLGMPGAVDSVNGVVRFSPNIADLAGRSIVADMKNLHARNIRIANDAACFALSESRDGAAAGAERVYGVILGTGVGGALITDGKTHTGPNAMQEWGHVPLPWSEATDRPRLCGCGRKGCIESYLSGPGLRQRVSEALGREVANAELPDLVALQNPALMPIMDIFCTRLAKACAMLVLTFDPDVIVFGGGVSNIDMLYQEVPKRIGNYTVLPDVSTRFVKAKHGDDSGMRGAAWLWPENSTDR